MKKNLIAVLSVLLAFSMMLCACGKEEAPETAATTVPTTVATTAPAETVPAEPMNLTDWTMNATTWSSPNGATIHITATPNYYADGQSAEFLVLLESDEIAKVPCEWDGTSYTASADLNAANGYCYYVVLTAADGTTAEVAVNTPAQPTNETFINMEAALEAYCSIVVEESAFEGNTLTLSSGSVQVKTPSITNEGETITCQEAVLVLTFNGEELSREVLNLTQGEGEALFETVLENIVFEVPAMENEQNVELSVMATLSNGQELSAFGGSWVYNEEGLMPVVG